MDAERADAREAIQTRVREWREAQAEEAVMREAKRRGEAYVGDLVAAHMRAAEARERLLRLNPALGNDIRPDRMPPLS